MVQQNRLDTLVALRLLLEALRQEEGQGAKAGKGTGRR
ncbi:MAG: hypothetical protein JWP00_1975 [Chloroflexi bacterium]|jgi:hypothetical protein|nr:hypothetical protein [Chloroflexota bacterium]